MLGQILQAIFGSLLIIAAVIGILPILEIQQEVITMQGLVYLVMLGIGLDIIGRAFHK